MLQQISEQTCLELVTIKKFIGFVKVFFQTKTRPMNGNHLDIVKRNFE